VPEVSCLLNIFHFCGSDTFLSFIIGVFSFPPFIVQYGLVCTLVKRRVSIVGRLLFWTGPSLSPSPYLKRKRKRKRGESEMTRDVGVL
jgi:hypothetical protein